MAVSLGAHRKQRVLVFERKKSAANIHMKLVNVYGKPVFDISIEKWRVKCNPRENGETDLSNRTAAFVNEDKLKRSDNFIIDHRRNTNAKVWKAFRGVMVVPAV